MKKYFKILRKCSLFSGIKDDDLILMLDCLNAEIIDYKKKETVIADGQTVKKIGIMLSGSAQIIQVDYFGNRSIVSGISPSDMFAESFACAGVTSIPVTVIANEDCKVMFIDCFSVLNSCGNACDFHRQIVYNLMKEIATKNIMFHQKIEITSKRTTREKLMTYLMMQAKKNSSSSFDIPFDRQELADYLEVDRSGLSAEISKLRHEGIIESRKNHFKLL